MRGLNVPMRRCCKSLQVFIPLLRYEVPAWRVGNEGVFMVCAFPFRRKDLPFDFFTQPALYNQCFFFFAGCISFFCLIN